MGIALVHDEGELADAPIGLAQLDMEPVGETDEKGAFPGKIQRPNSPTCSCVLKEADNA
jgi:hypothetical protein